jgi:hypothetical protein
MSDELTSLVLYRSAYGLAADLAEGEMYAMAWGRERAAGLGGASFDALCAEVAQRLDAAAGDPNLREAVEDALARRRPKW